MLQLYILIDSSCRGETEAGNILWIQSAHSANGDWPSFMHQIFVTVWAFHIGSSCVLEHVL